MRKPIIAYVIAVGLAVALISTRANASPAEDALIEELRFLAGLSEQDGELEKAAEAWARVLEIDPRNLHARSNLSRLEAEIRKRRDAAALRERERADEAADHELLMRFEAEKKDGYGFVGIGYSSISIRDVRLTRDERATTLDYPAGSFGAFDAIALSLGYAFTTRWLYAGLTGSVSIFGLNSRGETFFDGTSIDVTHFLASVLVVAGPQFTLAGTELKQLTLFVSGLVGVDWLSVSFEQDEQKASLSTDPAVSYGLRTGVRYFLTPLIALEFAFQLQLSKHAEQNQFVLGLHL